MPAEAPLWFRWVNGLASLAAAAGLRGPSLDPEGLERRARRSTGLSDLGPDDYREGLVRLCRSLQSGPAWNLVGRFLLRRTLTDALVKRLRWVEARKQRPGVFAASLRPPLLVVGLPRTGTTLLHRLLSLAEEARPLVLWEFLEPLPGPGRDHRRRNVQRRVRLLKRLAPDYEEKHDLDADAPDECALLLDGSFTSAVWCMVAPVFDYVAWVRTQDPRPAYAMYRDYLLHFQAQTPGQRLTLKAPLHTAYLDTLLETIPGLMVVQTHRDPLEVVPSLVGLFSAMYGVFSRVDRDEVTRFVTDVVELLIQRNLESRPRLPAGRVLDVAYSDLVADPIATARGVHAHFDLPWDPAHERRAAQWMHDHPHAPRARGSEADPAGVHAALARRFAGYRERFVPAAADARS